MPEQILQQGGSNQIKDSVCQNLASKVAKSVRGGRASIGRMSSSLLSWWKVSDRPYWSASNVISCTSNNKSAN